MGIPLWVESELDDYESPKSSSNEELPLPSSSSASLPETSPDQTNTNNTNNTDNSSNSNDNFQNNINSVNGHDDLSLPAPWIFQSTYSDRIRATATTSTVPTSSQSRQPTISLNLQGARQHLHIDSRNLITIQQQVHEEGIRLIQEFFQEIRDQAVASLTLGSDAPISRPTYATGGAEESRGQTETGPASYASARAGRQEPTQARSATYANARTRTRESLVDTRGPQEPLMSSHSHIWQPSRLQSGMFGFGFPVGNTYTYSNPNRERFARAHAELTRLRNGGASTDNAPSLNEYIGDSDSEFEGSYTNDFHRGVNTHWIRDEGPNLVTSAPTISRVPVTPTSTAPRAVGDTIESRNRTVQTLRRIRDHHEMPESVRRATSSEYLLEGERNLINAAIAEIRASLNAQFGQLHEEHLLSIRATLREIFANLEARIANWHADRGIEYRALMFEGTGLSETPRSNPRDDAAELQRALHSVNILFTVLQRSEDNSPLREQSLRTAREPSTSGARGNGTLSERGAALDLPDDSLTTRGMTLQQRLNRNRQATDDIPDGPTDRNFGSRYSYAPATESRINTPRNRNPLDLADPPVATATITYHHRFPNGTSPLTYPRDYRRAPDPRIAPSRTTHRNRPITMYEVLAPPPSIRARLSDLDTTLTNRYHTLVRAQAYFPTTVTSHPDRIYYPLTSLPSLSETAQDLYASELFTINRQSPAHPLFGYIAIYEQPQSTRQPEESESAQESEGGDERVQESENRNERVREDTDSESEFDTLSEDMSGGTSGSVVDMISDYVILHRRWRRAAAEEEERRRTTEREAEERRAQREVEEREMLEMVGGRKRLGGEWFAGRGGSGERERE